MTTERWLAQRTPAAPEALAARIRELVAESGRREGEVAESLVDAAERVLSRLLREGCATRHSALDLLAADAIATYAFEAAAEASGQNMVELTDAAMLRIAALADVPVEATPAQEAVRCR